MSGPLDTIGGTGGGAYSGATAPANPTADLLWYNTATGNLSIWDATRSAWISVTGYGGFTMPAATSQGKFLVSGPGGGFVPEWADADGGRY